MEKKTFVTKEQLDKITELYPTPFHLYDEKGIRETEGELKMERNKKKWKKIACLALTAALSFGLTNTDLLIARAEEIKDELTIIDDTGQDLEIITDEEELQEEEIVFEDEESPAVDTPVVDDNQTGIQDNNKTDTSTEQDKQVLQL